MKLTILISAMWFVIGFVLCYLAQGAMQAIKIEHHLNDKRYPNLSDSRNVTFDYSINYPDTLISAHWNLWFDGQIVDGNLFDKINPFDKKKFEDSIRSHCNNAIPTIGRLVAKTKEQ